MVRRSVIAVPMLLFVVFLGYYFLNQNEITLITTDQLKEKLAASKENVVFVDVREVEEFQDGHVEGMINIPLSTLKDNTGQIPIDAEVVVFCRSGNRSMQAARILQDQGFKKIINVEGGIMSWTGPLVK